MTFGPYFKTASVGPIGLTAARTTRTFLAGPAHAKSVGLTVSQNAPTLLLIQSQIPGPSLVPPKPSLSLSHFHAIAPASLTRVMTPPMLSTTAEIFFHAAPPTCFNSSSTW